MHVAIDGMRLGGQRLGVGRYIEYLLREWDRDESDDRVTVFVPATVDHEGIAHDGRVDIDVLESRLGGYPWQALVLGRAAGRSCDVLFGPSYRIPPRLRCPSVVAIHSVNEVQAGAHDRWYRYTHGQVNRYSARAATRVVVPSTSVLHDIQEAYGIDADKLDVVPQGADDGFRPLPADDPRVREARRRIFGDPDQPYVVWVGKLSNRRNIPLVIEAFARARAEHDLPHKLLLFGPNHLGLPLDDLSRQAGVTDVVVQDDGLVSSHEELVPVYAGADLYVNASAYEGFSMTLVEALSCGVPVVGVNRAAVGEIASGAALLIDEPDLEALAAAIGRVLTEPELSAELRAASLERATQYRWDRTARETMASLRRAVESGRG